MAGACSKTTDAPNAPAADKPLADQRSPFDGANCTGGGGAGFAGRRGAAEECEDAAAFGAAFGAAFALGAAAGRGAGAGVVLGAEDAGAAGSDVMMLTGGIEAEDGNSALVGLPLGGSLVNAAAAGFADGTELESVAAASAPLHIGV